MRQRKSQAGTYLETTVRWNSERYNPTVWFLDDFKSLLKLALELHAYS